MEARSRSSQTESNRTSLSAIDSVSSAALTDSEVPVSALDADSRRSVRRVDRARCLRALRWEFRRMFRATPISHGSSSCGISSRRRHATRNVSATTSSTSPGSRRQTYRRTASKCSRWRRVNRLSLGSGGIRLDPPVAGTIAPTCPGGTGSLQATRWHELVAELSARCFARGGSSGVRPFLPRGHAVS